MKLIIQRPFMVKIFIFFNLLLLSLVNFNNSLCFASEGITYQGRIFNAENKPLVASSVSFTLKVTSPNTNCVLYSENLSVDMSLGDGSFSMILGRGSRIDSGTHTFEKVFSPNFQTPVSPDCTAGFTRQAGDHLKLLVEFNDGTGVQALAPMEITGTPFSMDTLNVAGTNSQNVVRVSDGAAAPITSADFTELLSLLNGTSTLYAHSSGGGAFSEAVIPILTTPGKVSGSAINSGIIGGTTSISTSGSISTTGAISAGGTISTTGAMSADSVSANSILSRSMAISNVNNNYATLLAPAGVFTNYSLRLPASAGNSGQILSNDGSGNLIWQSPSTGLSTANSTTSGLLSSADWNSFNSKLPLAGGTMSGNILMNGFEIKGIGNLGIGTTTPGAPLDVKGALRLSGATSGFVGFQPSTNAGSTVWTLPTADGTNGQSLTTNGSGVLSWSSGGGLGTWSGATGPSRPGEINTGFFSSASGSLGFATLGFERMMVLTNEIIFGNNLAGMDNGITSVMTIEGSENNSSSFNFASLKFSNDSNNIGQGAAAVAGIDSWSRSEIGPNRGELHFQTKDGTTLSDRMTINYLGNVGIGTVTPSSLLNVRGGAIVSDAQTSATQCVNFSTGNIHVNSYSGSNTINIGGLVDGGAYTLVLTGFTGGQTVTINAYTNATCTAAVSTGVDFGGWTGGLTNTFIAAGNTQLITFIYSSSRGVVYASASTGFFH